MHQLSTEEKKPTCSVVIPVYNSEESLPILVASLAEILPKVSSEFEVILINDDSRDNSYKIIKELELHYHWVHGIHFMRNYGQHNALLCGIRTAIYEIIVTMDDDLQHLPEEIIPLLNRLSQGYDVVYGTPEAQQHGLWRNLASQVTKLVLQNAMGVETARQVSAFRAFRTSLREAFKDYDAPFVSIDALLTWGTTRFTAVSVKHQSRQYGISNYSFFHLILHTLNMITGFSLLPLRFATLLGFAFVLLGVLLLIYILGRFILEGSSVPGFPFLASTIVTFSGIQLFSLGIIGEYLSRIYLRTMNRPAYVIRQYPIDK